MIVPLKHVSADEIVPLRMPRYTYLCGNRIYPSFDLRERLEVRYYAYMRDKAQMLLWMKRKKRFFSIIEEVLKENNLPDDLKYMAVVESALIQRSYSPKGAVGVWQFVKGTARRFGLKVTRKYDERRDVYKATQAAVGYFNFLYEKFGNWPLVMAAYNIGEYRVIREVREQETANFFEMVFPRETDEYVINVMVVKHLMENAQRYGLEIEDYEYFKPFDFTEVDIKIKSYRKPVSVIANAAFSTVREIKELNPQIIGNFLYNGTYSIRIPKAGKAGFKERYAEFLAEYEKDNTYVKIIRNQAALRTGPGTDFKRIQTMKKGAKLKFLSASDELYYKKPWYEVEVKDKSYWVWSGLVTLVN
jgi:hypothetical protein